MKKLFASLFALVSTVAFAVPAMATTTSVLPLPQISPSLPQVHLSQNMLENIGYTYQLPTTFDKHIVSVVSDNNAVVQSTKNGFKAVGPGVAHVTVTEQFRVPIFRHQPIVRPLASNGSLAGDAGVQLTPVFVTHNVTEQFNVETGHYAFPYKFVAVLPPVLRMPVDPVIHLTDPVARMPVDPITPLHPIFQVQSQ